MVAMPEGPGRPDVLRSMNDHAALSLLIADGPLTRAQIGRATGLSSPTVSQVISRLLAKGSISEAGYVTSRRGPEALAYRVCAEASLGVALQMLPGSVTACVVDASGHAGAAVEIRLARERSASGDIAAGVQAACEAVDQPRDGVIAVCVGLPSAVSPDSGHLSFVGPLPGWPRRDVRAQVEAQLGLTVLMDNDANLAAIAEQKTRQDEDDFALLWQGEGLRVASVVGGQVQRGAAGGAGEIGYLAYPGEPSATKPATMQDAAGSTAVTRIVRGHVSSVRSYEAALTALRTSPQRADILAELAPRITALIVPIVAVLDPAKVVLGGPVGAACGSAGAALVQTHLRRTTNWRTPVVATAVTENPILRGAQLVLTRHLREHLLSCVT